MEYDVVVIGAGPAGYVAAIRTAQLGLKTACVNNGTNASHQPTLGGTCLNIGCIPSKALLDSSHYFHLLQHKSEEHGIHVGGSIGFSVDKLMQRKDKIVNTLNAGVAGLFKKNNIDFFAGTAELCGDGAIQVNALTREKEDILLKARHIIIATGSVPVNLPHIDVDQELIVDSTGALSFSEVPERLAIIGAGAIGLELGSVWSRLGAVVSIFEVADNFLPSVDPLVSKLAYRSFLKQGLNINLASKVTNVTSDGKTVLVTFEKDQQEKTQEFDRLVVAVGRKPNTTGLGAEKVGLALDQHGFIQIDADFKTNIPGIYAIGDVTGGALLAHKASGEAEILAEKIAGKRSTFDYDLIPWVIYTAPEIAWVGQSSNNAKAGSRTGVYPYQASGRAQAMGETEGIIKIISTASGRITGVHIFGANASELVAEGAMLMACDGNAEDLVRTVHAHPTLSEGLKEAGLSLLGKGLHV